MSASWLFWAVFDQSDCAAASAAAWFPFKDAGSSLGKLLPWRQESRRRDGVRCGVRLMRSKVLNVFKVFLPHQKNSTSNRLPVAWLREYSKNPDWSAAVCRTTSGRLRRQQTISSVSSTGTRAHTPVLHNTRTGKPVTDTAFMGRGDNLVTETNSPCFPSNKCISRLFVLQDIRRSIFLHNLLWWESAGPF